MSYILITSKATSIAGKEQKPAIKEERQHEKSRNQRNDQTGTRIHPQRHQGVNSKHTEVPLQRFPKKRNSQRQIETRMPQRNSQPAKIKPSRIRTRLRQKLLRHTRRTITNKRIPKKNLQDQRLTKPNPQSHLAEPRTKTSSYRQIHLCPS